ncbi:MAG TPA: DNA internalization-related competence protein ComEC/Rec2 [Gammaproteobacteria bacterium]|nr:DNA internalization-related competence protein ComEC/Rec2 [Gammaproteobacteria bacterium]
MLLNTLAFVAGICLLHSCSVLPAWPCYLLLLAVIPLLRRPLLHAPALFVIGFFWASWRAELALSPQLPRDLEAQTVLVQGSVLDMPTRSASGILRFRMQVEQMNAGAGWRDFHGRIRLNWYKTPVHPRPGEHWHLAVRLKRPHGFSNPGGFDYERWLFQQRIRATGYVREDDRNRQLVDADPDVITAMRIRLQLAMENLQADKPTMAMIRALTIGDRSAISVADWSTLRNSGTSHLMAISGLHISLVGGLLFWLARRLWAYSGGLAEAVPARKIAALLAIAGALLYAMLAGFGIPARRAVIMVTMVMFAVVFNRRSGLVPALCLAAVATLLIDPLSVLSAGWWLSFWAVSLIAYLATGRHGRQGFAGRWVYMHVLLALGMLPVLLVFFQSASLVAPFANVVAVPWVGLLVVPLALLGSLVTFLHAATGEALLLVAASLLEPLWFWLDWLAKSHLSTWQQHQPSAWTLLVGIPGLLLLIAPRGVPGRWLGLLLLLPLFLIRPDRPAPGEVRMTLLDVGQGLAAIVQTQDHVLVYDTGPRFSGAFDTGTAVVIPFLRSQGISSIDTLVVSHGDNDHIGGAASLLSVYRDTRVVSSVPEKVQRHTAEHCLGGQHWEWDGVHFRILHPDDDAGPQGNNASCVLKIEVAGGAGILLTGDIEREVEDILLHRYGGELRATVLVVPHHGSNTSSTPAFLARVDPAIALFPAGYLNRYRFPKQAVIQRLDSMQVDHYQTGLSGAITVSLGVESRVPEFSLYREQVRRYWMSIR